LICTVASKPIGESITEKSGLHLALDLISSSGFTFEGEGTFEGACTASVQPDLGKWTHGNPKP